MTDLIINIPFAGFYESLYSSEIDSLEEREAEHFEEYRQEEDGIPSHLRLDAEEVREILIEVVDYKALHEKMAESYTDAFNFVISEDLGLELGLRFEKMDSPREYNFTTDRIFAYISQEVVAELFKRSEVNEHRALAEVIKDRFTSYDGFISGYRNDLQVWLDKPLEDWDHNELDTLLIANMRLSGVDSGDLEERVYYRCVDCDGFYQEWESSVNWGAFDEKVADLREEKAEEWRLEHPGDPAPQPRCPDTLEMKL